MTRRRAADRPDIFLFTPPLFLVLPSSSSSSSFSPSSPFSSSSPSLSTVSASLSFSSFSTSPSSVSLLGKGSLCKICTSSSDESCMYIVFFFAGLRGKWGISHVSGCVSSSLWIMICDSAGGVCLLLFLYLEVDCIGVVFCGVSMLCFFLPDLMANADGGCSM